jgi:hypothetical protein
VDDFPLMAMSYRREQLLHDLGCLILSEDLFISNHLKKLASTAVLSDYIEIVFVLKEFEKLHNVRVIHHLHQSDFILDCLQLGT